MQKLRAYLLNLLIALDQFAGALILGNKADITISAQAWLWHITGKRSWPARLIDAVFWLDPEHCHQSYLSELRGRQLPPELGAKGERND